MKKIELPKYGFLIVINANTFFKNVNVFKLDYKDIYSNFDFYQFFNKHESIFKNLGIKSPNDCEYFISFSKHFKLNYNDLTKNNT